MTSQLYLHFALIQYMYLGQK